MRVLLVTSLFPPDIGANAKRMAHLAEDLRARGHQVTVITAFPHYPHGVVSSKYKGRMCVRDDYDGIDVLRTYVYASSQRTFFRRLLNFISFTLTSFLGSWRLKGSYDMVVTISPPLLSGVSAYLISLLKRSRFVFDVQDIYPETAVVLGVLKNKPLIKLAGFLEKFIYEKASLVVVISEGFRRDIVGKGISERKVVVVPNWVDIDAFRPKDGVALRHEYGLEGKFVVMFMGTIGLAQGAEYIVESARLLATYADISFVFLGDGAEKKKIADMAAGYGLQNVGFLPAQPNARIPDFLSMADLCLVHLRKDKLYAITIPSKTYEYMAAQKPIVMGVLGEARQLVRDAECGLDCAPESPEEMASAILRFYHDQEVARKCGERGYRYVAERYSRKRIMEKYLSAIEDAAKKSRPQ